MCNDMGHLVCFIVHKMISNDPVVEKKKQLNLIRAVPGWIYVVRQEIIGEQRITWLWLSEFFL